jgi:release factor glutamine methyltransferase
MNAWVAPAMTTRGRSRAPGAVPESLGELTAAAAARLAEAGIDSVRLDARLLAAHAFGVTPARLIGHPEHRPTPAERHRFAALVARRAAREPIAYILGRREFWGLELRVSKATLVPRPETETVVELALGIAGGRDDGDLAILDLGTGTGCLLLALLSELPDARGLGVDVSAKALTIARANARRLGLAGRARFRISDWGERVGERFDLVVANPPYVADSDFAQLAPEVRRFEPRLALSGGADGLAQYRLLVPGLRRLLKPQASVILEIGDGQADAVEAILEGHRLKVSGVRADLAGRPRAIAANTDF